MHISAECKQHTTPSNSVFLEYSQTIKLQIISTLLLKINALTTKLWSSSLANLTSVQHFWQWWCIHTKNDIFRTWPQQLLGKFSVFWYTCQLRNPLEKQTFQIQCKCMYSFVDFELRVRKCFVTANITKYYSAKVLRNIAGVLKKLDLLQCYCGTALQNSIVLF